MKKKVVVVIMDGWGIAAPDKFNAIDNAKTPNIDRLTREYPNTQLKSDGLAVGLPEGQFGTSEVNHMTIGAGRIILQDLPRINHAIENEEFYTNQALNKSIDHAIKNNSNVHLTGIVSDGGIHSMYLHLFAILETLSRKNFENEIFIHAFTDGRDTPPKSIEKYLRILDEEIKKYKNLKIKLATLQGRFYLDRDRDWAKTDMAFDLIAKGQGNKVKDWQAAVNLEYNQNNNDEFFTQYLFEGDGVIKPNDSVIFFHYRTDRLYQLLKRLIQENIDNLSITTFISISEEFDKVNIAFPRLKIENTLAEVISNEGFTQMHIAETEKYPHVTFFLNGEKEKEMVNEEWKMHESNRFVKPMYNFEPSMRNFAITKDIISAIEDDKYDFIIANLSSPDMVGHTGNYEAAIVSAESIDYCIGKIFDATEAKLKDYALLITSDHGNSDIMWDYENNQPHTQHTTSPVPFILVSDLKCKLHRRDSLADLAPTVLDLMGIKQPVEMKGESLIIRE
jgi:2,3-bisphosphoglycerate-independent phosphoglycerate mutase